MQGTFSAGFGRLIDEKRSSIMSATHGVQIAAGKDASKRGFIDHHIQILSLFSANEQLQSLQPVHPQRRE